MKKTLAVLGGGGMLGSDLVRFLQFPFDVVSISRENYHQYIGNRFDIFINANGNSRRFWALEHPQEDFEASTISTYRSIFDFKTDMYIYISSSDVYTTPSDKILTKETVEIVPQDLNHYGFHKYLSELIIKHFCPKYLILRSSMILGTSLKKGPFFDILSDKELFIKLNSKIQLITTEEIGNIIEFLIKKGVGNCTINIGGVGSFDFKNIKKYFQNKLAVAKEANIQHYDMNVDYLSSKYPLKRSEEYLQAWLTQR